MFHSFFKIISGLLGGLGRPTCPPQVKKLGARGVTNTPSTHFFDLRSPFSIPKLKWWRLIKKLMVWYVFQYFRLFRNTSILLFKLFFVLSCTPNCNNESLFWSLEYKKPATCGIFCTQPLHSLTTSLTSHHALGLLALCQLWPLHGRVHHWRDPKLQSGHGW